MNISLRQIRAFASVAKHLSVTQAARELHLTQSAVSMLLQQMEQQLGFTAFLRQRGRMALTRQGEELLVHAHRVLADMDQLNRCVQDLQRGRPEVLRIAVPQLLACTWMSHVLEPFAQAHPEVALTVVDGTADEVSEVVRKGEADVGIGPDRPVTEDMHRVFLAEVPMVLVFARSHPLAQCAHVAWQDLRAESWIVYSSQFNQDLQKIFERHQINLGACTVTQVMHLTTALSLAGNGMGVTAVPHYAMQLASSFGLCHLPLQSPVLQRDFFIYHRKGALLSPAAEHFAALMGAQLRSAPTSMQPRGVNSAAPLPPMAAVATVAGRGRRAALVPASAA